MVKLTGLKNFFCKRNTLKNVLRPNGLLIYWLIVIFLSLTFLMLIYFSRFSLTTVPTWWPQHPS